MKPLILTVAILALPAVAVAQTITCQSIKTCDGHLNCSPFESVLEITVAPDGAATLMWDGVHPFQGTTVQADDPLVVIPQFPATSAFMFVMGQSGDATYSTTSAFVDYVIPGFYTLKCTQ
jgi:hypothetical protein